jgi:uncharacterized protein (DUF1786 family)
VPCGAREPLRTPRPLRPLWDIAELIAGELEELVGGGARPHEVATALLRGRRVLAAMRSRVQKRFAIGRSAAVGELVGVDNRADALNLTAADVEHHDADHPLAAVEQQRSGAAVDLGRPQVNSRDTGGDPDPVHERARDRVAPARRACQGGHFPPPSPVSTTS